MIRILIYKNSISEDSEYKEYILDNDELLVFNDIRDVLTIDVKGNYTINRKIKYNEYGGYKLVDELEEGKILNFYLYDGVNVVVIDSGKETKLKYVIKNPFNEGTRAMVMTSLELTKTELKLLLDEKTDKQEVTSMIELNNQGIDLEVSKKVDKEEVISAINLTPEEAKIQASKIKLEGYTTINNNFSVDLEGNMSCNNADINGELVTAQGVYTGLIFNQNPYGSEHGNIKPLNGEYALTGYELRDYTYGQAKIAPRVSLEINYSIPTNFVVDHAYVEVKNRQTTFRAYNMENELLGTYTGNLGPFQIWKGSGFNTNPSYVDINVVSGTARSGLPETALSGVFQDGSTGYSFTKTGMVRTKDLKQHLDTAGALYVTPVPASHGTSSNYPYHSAVALQSTAWATAKLFVFGWIRKQ